MSFAHLPEDQAQRAEHDLKAIAELLATRSDDQLFGQTEFDLRRLVHRLGGEALQTAAEQRKKEGTKVPV
jgi:hypothetical protein